MQDALLLCELFDIYGPLLSARQQEVFSLRYTEDLSLAEIAETLSISRQGVRDAILHAEETLLRAEDRLGLRAREEALRRDLDELESLARNGDCASLVDTIAAIRARMEE
ncbi:MAG: hypothetical protein IJC53_06275 [Clostridia bacterium]|nr:hypothetical protein [Clostridia bacterium]